MASQEIGLWLLFFWIVFAVLGWMFSRHVGDEIEWCNFESVMHLLLWFVSLMCLIFGIVEIFGG